MSEEISQLRADIDLKDERIYQLEAELRAKDELIAGLQADQERLDWLEAFCQTGCVGLGFEFDGGVYLQVETLGDQPKDFREQNGIRTAIDAARSDEPSNTQEKPE